MTIKCAIHQPNFFPWLGYFDKIKRADVFVFLDDTQNIKTGGSWVNRVKLNCKGSEKWYTCPIKKPSGLTAINKVEFADNEWKESFMNVLTDYYKNYGNFYNCNTFIRELLNNFSDSYLADFNKNVIVDISKRLGIKTKFISKSELNIDTKSTQMLIDICKAVNADTYLCGGGASGYQDDDEFANALVRLEYQNFTPSAYNSSVTFIPGLSIIDYFMSNQIGE